MEAPHGDDEEMVSSGVGEAMAGCGALATRTTRGDALGATTEKGAETEVEAKGATETEAESENGDGQGRHGTLGGEGGSIEVRVAMRLQLLAVETSRNCFKGPFGSLLFWESRRFLEGKIRG